MIPPTRRSTAARQRWCPATDPDAEWSTDPGTCSPPCLESTVGRTPRRSARASSTSSIWSRKPGPGRPRRGCGCCPTGSPSTDLLAGSDEPRPGLGSRCCSESVRMTSRRSASTPTPSPTGGPRRGRVRARAPLLRAYLREVDAHPRAGAGRRSCSSTTAASLLGEVPDALPARPPDLRGPGRARAGRPRVVPGNAASPGPDVTPEQLRQPVLVERRRGASWWSTTTTWSPPAQRSPVQALQPLLAPGRATSACTSSSRAAPAAPPGPSTSRCSQYAARPGGAGAGAVRQPRGGAARRRRAPRPAPPGRGRLVTRDRGVEVVQVAWCERAA